MSTRKSGWKPRTPEAQGFLRHGNQRRVRRDLRRGPRGVADGKPGETPAPSCRVETKRDTGTKLRRPCGRPSNQVGEGNLYRDGTARRRGNPMPSAVESTGKKSSSGSGMMSVPETDTGGRGEQPQVNE